MIKFGKKSKDILDVKGGFITDNLELFNWQKKLFNEYNWKKRARKTIDVYKKFN